MLTDQVFLDVLLVLFGVPTAAYGFVKSPLWGWMVAPVRRRAAKTRARWEAVEAWNREWEARVQRLEVCWDSMTDRMDTIETAIAPTNGDRRPISDRVDTVKYQGKVINSNIGALAAWMAKLNPHAEPPVILPLPDR